MSEDKPEATISQAKDLIVVAIGSPAGGLEALGHLFHHLPVESAFTYVVAHHLASEHSVLLTDFLARETALPVRQLNGDTPMEPATIYITAPNTDLLYLEGLLRVVEPNDSGPKPPSVEGKSRFPLPAPRSEVRRTLKPRRLIRWIPKKIRLRGNDGLAQGNVFPAARPTQGEQLVAARPAAGNDERIQELERELHTTRDHLQAVVVELEASNERLLTAVQRLLNGFSRPLFPADGGDARNADHAINRTNSDGWSGCRIYDHRLESEICERVSIERDLSRALVGKELWIAFQPQLSLQTNQIVGAECLLRWSPAVERNIPISKVISVAEESGLILDIGQWVIRESLRQLKLWTNQGRSIRIAVNLSAVQFNQQDVFAMVMELLNTFNLPPACLKAEITETVLLNRSARVKESLHALHGAGIGLVLDDFGTGYSSLTYLQQYPIESVKIDASFLQGIGRNGNDEAIVRGIIKLAHSLGQRVVAEGVETRVQLDFLRANDCDYAQGFLFAKPLPRQEFEAYLTKAAGAS